MQIRGNAMTNHSTFSPHDTAHENIVTFPHTGNARGHVASAMIDGHGSDGIPERFTLCDDGIYELRSGDEENLVPVKICSPVVVMGRCRTAAGHGWGRVVSVQDPEGTWHELVYEGRQLSQSPNVALAPLFDLGLELAPARKAAESVMLLLRSWQLEAVYLRCHRVGWASDAHDAFVLGNGRVIGHALVTTDSVPDDMKAATNTRGTLDAWKNEVAARCVGNPLMMLAVSHAFSGPLLSILGQTGGGFHLRGESSRGKSTIQYVASSVWGAPSLLQSWNGTLSGLEGVAAACNDTLLNLEELHNADPRTVGETVYMLGNGKGRNRAKANGKPQSAQQWRVSILSSGEVTLEEHMAKAGREFRAGQAVRLINMEADCRMHGAFDDLRGAHDGSTFAEQLNQASLENYGHAGPLFVEHVMGNREKKKKWQEFIDDLCRSVAKRADLSQSNGQAHRVLKRFAIAALAGELATKADLTGWPAGGAKAAAWEMFRDWFDAEEGVTTSEIDTAVQRTRDYIAKHPERFQMIGTEDNPPVDGWRDDHWVYIRTECWQKIHAPNNPSEVARLHADGGFLKTQKSGGFQVRMGRQIEDRPWTYAVNAAKLREIGEPER
jgi:putative DNA primase/helicase